MVLCLVYWDSLPCSCQSLPGSCQSLPRSCQSLVGFYINVIPPLNIVTTIFYLIARFNPSSPVDGGVEQTSCVEVLAVSSTVQVSPHIVTSDVVGPNPVPVTVTSCPPPRLPITH